jgi:hypothetical protein
MEVTPTNLHEVSLKDARLLPTYASLLSIKERLKITATVRNSDAILGTVHQELISDVQNYLSCNTNPQLKNSTILATRKSEEEHANKLFELVSARVKEECIHQYLDLVVIGRRLST